jgi:hypothetical protein
MFDVLSTNWSFRRPELVNSGPKRVNSGPERVNSTHFGSAQTPLDSGPEGVYSGPERLNSGPEGRLCFHDLFCQRLVFSTSRTVPDGTMVLFHYAPGPASHQHQTDADEA